MKKTRLTTHHSKGRVHMASKRYMPKQIIGKLQANEAHTNLSMPEALASQFQSKGMRNGSAIASSANTRRVIGLVQLGSLVVN